MAKQTETRPRSAARLDATDFHVTEYKEIHEQRMALIRSYNVWFAIGCAIAFSSFWLILNLSLTMSSRPMLIAGALVASAIMGFSYRAVLSIDREVVALYPRIIFLELLLGYDFYRDYLRRRPRGNSERSYVERCEQIDADNPYELWGKTYSLFNRNDFPAARRLSVHFKKASYFSIILFWLIIALILVPQYFPLAR
ncbi:MAG: hypothetical protein JKX93_00685 [Rhizobiaceae bacterium]|nr:hypothetical protein [Rhizobiaceae bacterium]